MDSPSRIEPCIETKHFTQFPVLHDPAFRPADGHTGVFVRVDARGEGKECGGVKHNIRHFPSHAGVLTPLESEDAPKVILIGYTMEVAP